MKLKTLAIFLVLVTAGFSQQKPKLTDYKYNVYSQWGEDGMIEKIFEVIGTTSKVAVEFGACDGFLFSNTANLWAKQPEWRGVLIESNVDYYRQLTTNLSGLPVTSIHATVGISPSNSLEAILQKAGVNSAIDILSIDVDGDDYYLLQSLEHLRPRVIICEYNPSIPAHLDVYGDYGNFIGCSVAALERVAKEKGYSLIAITDTNCFFVVNEEFPKFTNFETDRDHISIDRWTAFIISDYRGDHRVIGTSNNAEPWGWTQSVSKERLHGDITVLPAAVNKPRTRY